MIRESFEVPFNPEREVIMFRSGGASHVNSSSTAFLILNASSRFPGPRGKMHSTQPGFLAITSCGLFPNAIGLVGKVRTTAIATFANTVNSWRFDDTYCAMHICECKNEEQLPKIKSYLQIPRWSIAKNIPKTRFFVSHTCQGNKPKSSPNRFLACESGGSIG